MKAVIIGCGRVGASVAKQLAGEGWDVTCVDDDEMALTRLGDWQGGFVVGHGMDLDVLDRAGVAGADAAVVSTDGDNSNVVIGQMLQRRYEHRLRRRARLRPAPRRLLRRARAAHGLPDEDLHRDPHRHRPLVRRGPGRERRVGDALQVPSRAIRGATRRPQSRPYLRIWALPASWPGMRLAREERVRIT